MLFLGLINVPTWLVLTLILLITIYVFTTWNHDTFSRMGVAFVKPWPIIGSMGADLFKVVHTCDVERTKEMGRIFGYFEVSTPTLLVSDPDFIRDIFVKEFNSFSDHRTFDLRHLDPILNLFLTTLKGDDWKMTRNVMTPTFTSGKLKQMAPLMAKCGEQLNKILEEKCNKDESFQVKETYQAYLMEVIASCIFGIEITSQTNKEDKFMVNAKKMMFDQIKMVYLLLFLFCPEFIRNKVKIPILDVEALRFFKNTVAEVIHQRQTTAIRRNDFLQLMLDALKEADEDPAKKTDSADGSDKSSEYRNAVKKVLTTDGVVAQSVLFLLAGFETVSVCLTYVSYLLAIHPECQDKLLQEIDDVLAANDGKVSYTALSQLQYLDMIISEALRMYPPAIRLDRICTKDCVVRDVPIPKGMPIAIPIYAIHHDEEYYDDPYKFIPERFSPENRDARNSFTYLPFGAGPRNCIGMRFALMEVKSSLVHILRDFRLVRAPETDVPLTFKTRTPMLVPVNPIVLKVVKRHT